MDKKERKHTRSLRVSMALSKREWNLMKKAAKIVGEAPTPFIRNSAKKVARAVCARAGVPIRMDRPISAQGASVAPSEEEVDAT